MVHELSPVEDGYSYMFLGIINGIQYFQKVEIVPPVGVSAEDVKKSLSEEKIAKKHSSSDAN